VDIHNDGFGGAASAPDVRAPDNKILDVYSMTKTQLISLADEHGLLLTMQHN